MKHGILNQYPLTETNEFQTLYTFSGEASYTLTFVNHAGTPAQVSVAQIPENGVLANKHWLIRDEEVATWRQIPVKFLANAGDRLVLKASELVSVTVQGIENA